MRHPPKRSQLPSCAHTFLKRLLVACLVVGTTGCGALAGINPFDDEDENEVTGVIEAIDAPNNTLTVEGIVYTVTDDTEFEGPSGLSDFSTGEEVEIEYKEENGERIAVEVERPEEDDDD